MTKPNYTHIHVLFDRSGSMAGHESDIDGWYKIFFKEQKELPGECTVSLAEFDSESYDQVVGWSNIKDISEHYHLSPRGSTPLYDSLARSINTLGEKLGAMRENERPSRVLVVVQTDGLENMSIEWTKEKLKKLIEQQQKEYAWEFLFLGAGIDAYSEASAVGIRQKTTLSTGHNRGGYMASANISTAAVGRWRAGGELSYTKDEQEAAEATKNTP